MRFLVWVVVNAVALAARHLAAGRDHPDRRHRAASGWPCCSWSRVVFGVVNAVVRPV